jgi:hypothetical protein
MCMPVNNTPHPNSTLRWGWSWTSTSTPPNHAPPPTSLTQRVGPVKVPGAAADGRRGATLLAGVTATEVPGCTGAH